MTETRDKPAQGQKIAVVGGGVAGIVAAHLLQQKHEKPQEQFEQKK